MSASVLFAAPRVIADASKIPFLGSSDEIGLVRTANIDGAALRAGGARGGTKGRRWYITRAPSVLLEPLDQFLPQIARKSIIPNIVDLIPETSWGASLANILTTSAWAQMRDQVIRDAGGCEDCGYGDKLECHELWSYDEVTGVQTLRGLRSVCSLCHETYHLGLASVHNRYGLAIARLALINRINKREVADFEEAIFSKFLQRSELEWALDLSLLAGRRLSIKTKFSQIGPNVIGGETKAGEVEVMLSGIEILEPTASGRPFVLT